ncbi:MAG TPA: hypothetical protein ENH29_07705 [Bacteroidetes bacterium]|nr:hypothetical protein [Bacteroidota bacterium]
MVASALKLTTLFPAYFPPLFWWQKAGAADVVVLLDDLPKPRLSHIDRCQVKSAEGRNALTIPVHGSKKEYPVINQLKIDTTKNWRRVHCAGMQSNYSNSPYFEYYFPCLVNFWAGAESNFSEVCLKSIRLVAKLLRLNLNFVFHSQWPTKGEKENRVMELMQRHHCQSYVIEANHDTYFRDDFLLKKSYFLQEIRPNSSEYEQQFGRFIPGLSILDTLFNEGPYVVQLMNEE